MRLLVEGSLSDTLSSALFKGARPARCRAAAYALFFAGFYRRISEFLYKMFLHLQDMYGIIFQHSTQLWMPGRCPHGLAGERKKLEVTN